MRRPLAGLVAVATLTASLATAAPPADDPLLDVAQAELDRLWEALATRPEPPHHLQLAIVDTLSVRVEATHGASNGVRSNHTRQGDVDIRVGTPQLDNTHQLRDATWYDEEPRPEVVLPLSADPARPTAMALWQATDEAYATAVRRLIKVRSDLSVKVASEDSSADFWPAPPRVDLGPTAGLDVDDRAWEERVRTASAAFRAWPQVHDDNVSFTAQATTTSLLTSEGTRLRTPRTWFRVSIWASTTADDGMELSVFDYLDAAGEEGLPTDLSAMASAAAERLVALRNAPVVDPFAGPAILRGRAAAVFFHEILGHRVEGHRQKDEDEGQTFTAKVGEYILPEFLSVHDDPKLERLGDLDLAGHYLYDDEGVAPQRVTVVDHGILRNFLLSRSPIDGFSASNGHGRRQTGAAPTPRQGNLLVSASSSVPYAQLRVMLKDEIRASGAPFGLVFDDISGGFTFTGRSTPNAYTVTPVTVWRVHADDRPDELVRGVDLIGTPLTTFSRIVAASDEVSVFNGTCGAESGWVPVSAAAPDLLVSQVEVQRREKAHDRPPLLPPPGAAP